MATLPDMSAVTPEMIEALRAPERTTLDIVNEARIRIGLDPGAGRDLTALTVGVGDWRTVPVYPNVYGRDLVEAPNMTATEVELRTAEYACRMARLYGNPALEDAAVGYQRQMEAPMFAQQHRLLNDFVAFGTAMYFVEPQAPRVEAIARGEKLLREWLSPTQLADYDQAGIFEVRGCDTRARYRISKGSAYNVEEVGRSGDSVARLCFMPEGDLVVGDMMLAQKIALETNETAALKVANIRVMPCLAQGFDLRPGGVNYVEGNPEPRERWFRHLFEGRWA